MRRIKRMLKQRDREVQTWVGLYDRMKDQRDVAQAKLKEAEEALFKCAEAAGEDTSGGVPTWPPIGEWALRAVSRTPIRI